MSLQKKKNKKVVINEVVLSPKPINVFSPLPMSQECAPSPSPCSVPKVLAHPILDSRKGNGIVNDFTTNLNRIAL